MGGGDVVGRGGNGVCGGSSNGVLSRRGVNLPEDTAGMLSEDMVTMYLERDVATML